MFILAMACFPAVDNDNWKCKLDKLQSVLNLWSSRELSFTGRAMIINVLGASRFWHVDKVLPPPKHVIDITVSCGRLLGKARLSLSVESAVVRLLIRVA